MKKYRVHRSFHMSCEDDVTVEASSRSEAEEKALKLTEDDYKDLRSMIEVNAQAR